MLPGKLSWYLQIPLTETKQFKTNQYTTRLEKKPDLFGKRKAGEVFAENADGFPVKINTVIPSKNCGDKTETIIADLYKKTISLAREKDATSITLPLFTAKEHFFGVDRVLKIAEESVSDALINNILENIVL